MESPFGLGKEGGGGPAEHSDDVCSTGSEPRGAALDVIGLSLTGTGIYKVPPDLALAEGILCKNLS